MKKGRIIISLIIIVCLSISTCICAKGILEVIISRKVTSWLSEEHEIFTSQLTDEQQSQFVSAVQDFANDYDFILISQSKTVQQTGSRLYTFSIFISSNTQNISFEPLTLMGTPIVDKALIQKVATGDIDSYAGFGNEAFKQIAGLPSVRSSAYFRIERFESGNKLGSSCKVIGLNQEDFQRLVDNIASSTGISKENLTTRLSGSTSIPGLIYVFSGGAFIILSIVFCLLTLTFALLELKTLGVHMMLGWSKSDYIFKLFSSQALLLLAVIPISTIGAYLTLDGFALNEEIFRYVCTTMLPPVAVVVLSMGFASIPFIAIKPVDAIASRYSRRGFYILTVVSYLICLVAVFSGCLYIDQPLKMYQDVIHTRSTWSEYSNWYVLQDYTLNEGRFTGNPMNYSKDMYTWYAAHEHDDGVFLANVSYYTDIAIQARLPHNTDLKPFWYLAASPSYLKQIGVPISDEDIAKAESGVRVYLLPTSLGSTQKAAIERLLQNSHRSYDSNIITTFMKNPEYQFSTYDGTQQLFTWSAGADQPATADNFVIAVITANNMVPFESESLIADGLENDYIKLNETAASKLLDDKKSVSLNENSLQARFATVENYINGLSKTLEDLFVLFSVVLIMMIVTIAIMLVCLINVVNRMNAREIGVKYVLGFSTWDMYKREILFVNLTIALGTAICGACRSNAGLIVGGVLLVISNVVIFDAVRRKSASVVLETVSKEQ